MAHRYYVKASYPGSNSYSVMDRTRRNEFGEQWCEIAQVTLEEANKCAASLNAGKNAYDWIERAHTRFDEAEVGTFDGVNTVYSDADPGL